VDASGCSSKIWCEIQAREKAKAGVPHREKPQPFFGARRIELPPHPMQCARSRQCPFSVQIEDAKEPHGLLICDVLRTIHSRNNFAQCADRVFTQHDTPAYFFQIALRGIPNHTRSPWAECKSSTVGERLLPLYLPYGQTHRVSDAKATQ
jgi:hypothetical protein